MRSAITLLVAYLLLILQSTVLELAPVRMAAPSLGLLVVLHVGLSAKWNGNATIDYWKGYKWTKGSYSYWKVGQYQTIAGYEAVRQGTVCSLASTRRSTSRDSWKAAPSRASAPRTRSSPI